MKDTKKEAKRIYEEIQGGVKEVLNGIRNFIEGEVIFQTQLAFGVGGAALVGAMAPVVSAIGMFAMFINDYQILVEREVSTHDHEPEVHGNSEEAKQDTKDSDEAEIIEILDEDEDTSTRKDSEKTVGK